MPVSATSGPVSATRSAVLALDVELEHVAIAHEARDVQIRGLRVHFLRRGDLLHDAVLHHDDAVGQRQRLVLVVRHVDRRAAELAVDAADLGARLDAQLGVEVRQRLVHQDQRRLDDDRARDRDALLLAAGELAGQLVLLADQLHELQRVRDAWRRSSAPATPRIRRPKPTFFATLMCGNSA